MPGWRVSITLDVRLEPVNEARFEQIEPRLSPDGQRVALEIIDGARTDVWTYDLARDVMARLTYDGGSCCPTWTPDGRRLVFNSIRTGVYNLFAQAADGSEQAEQLLPSETLQWISSLSRDGQMLTFGQESAFDAADIWIMSLGPERKVRPLLRMPSTQYQGVISPNGRWAAYISDETGRFEVYVTSFPSASGRYQVSRTEDLFPERENRGLSVLAGRSRAPCDRSFGRIVRDAHTPQLTVGVAEYDAVVFWFHFVVKINA